MNPTIIFVLLAFPAYSWTSFQSIKLSLSLIGLPITRVLKILFTHSVLIHMILMIPLMLLSSIALSSNQFLSIIGLEPTLPLWIPVGLIVGALLFLLYCVVRAQLPVCEQNIRHVTYYPQKNQTLTVMITPVMEEFLWRGTFITALLSLHVPTILSLILSALSFGTIHYVFGVKEILFKTIDGWFYSILFILSGSFIVSSFAHALYNLLIHLQMKTRYE